jgi:cell division protein DivIC
MNMQDYKPFLAKLKNKYVITIIAFTVWMLFFDTKDVGFMLSNSNKLKDLKASEKEIMKNIADTKKELSLLKSDAGSIEKYARERYFMKKDNEDLFITHEK